MMQASPVAARRIDLIVLKEHGAIFCGRHAHFKLWEVSGAAAIGRKGIEVDENGHAALATAKDLRGQVRVQSRSELGLLLGWLCGWVWLGWVRMALHGTHLPHVTGIKPVVVRLILLAWQTVHS